MRAQILGKPQHLLELLGVGGVAETARSKAHPPDPNLISAYIRDARKRTRDLQGFRNMSVLIQGSARSSAKNQDAAPRSFEKTTVSPTSRAMEHSVNFKQDSSSEDDDERIHNQRSQSRQSSIGPETIRRIAEEITKEKPYACTWEGCVKRFTKHQKLKAHVCMVHEGRKPYPCTHEGCAMSFQTPSKLRKHHLVHSVLNKTLRAHMKMHDASRPQVTCTAEGCTKVFSTGRTLAAHVKLAHQSPECAPNFKCEYTGCGKAFSYKHVLERHRKRIHEASTPRKKRRDAIEGTFMDSIVGFTAGDTEAKLPFACMVPGCTRRYTTEKLLQRHLQSQVHEVGDVTGMDVLHSMAEAENQSIRDMIHLHIQDQN
ncbi:hypothetical protein BGZ72_010768 [Mortierella alpina]|nr:hypothetical protein BGZ72_010768 [Mortierella alpina]